MSKFRSFSHFFNKHLRNGKTPLSKLAADVVPDGFKGRMFLRRVDKHGNIGKPVEISNELTNLSKSTFIRLLAQSASPWRGNIDPANYAIDRMRFGNAQKAKYSAVVDLVTRIEEYQALGLSSTQKALHYYDITEASSRPGAPVSIAPVNTLTDAELLSAYSRGNKNTARTGSSFSFQILRSASIQGINNANSQPTRIYNPGFGTTGDARPFSHGTLKVDLINSLGQIVERIVWGQSQYIRSVEGNFPTVIYVKVGNEPGITTPNNIAFVSGTFQGDPAQANYDPNLFDVSGNWKKRIVAPDSTFTKLFFDFDKDQNNNWGGWKILIDEINPTVPGYTAIHPKFEVGKFNIINSVVPRKGTNKDQGITTLNRYNISTQDYYSIGANKNFKLDGKDAFVDDWSIDFSVFMPTDDGNADGTVKYTEAFLQSKNDDIFSMIQLPESQQFSKSDEDSFLITWSISAPLS